MNFFDGTKIEEQRVLLAVYPILYVGSFPKSHSSLMRCVDSQTILLHTGMDDTHTVTLTSEYT